MEGHRSQQQGEVLLERLREYVHQQGGELMPGWRVEVKTRSSGGSAGTNDAYYFSPSGQRFRSRQEIMRHLETGAVQTKKGWLQAAEGNRQRQTDTSHSQAGSKQEQQGLAQPKVDAASDSSQGQGEAAPGRMPAAPLFVAQSPAGKSQADEWVKKHLAMHPGKSEEEALRAWKQKRRQALSLKGTPDRACSEQPSQASPSLDSAPSAMPQLGQGQHAPQAAHQARGAAPTAPSGLAAAPRLPARATNRFASPISHGQVLVSKDKHHATAAAVGTAKQPPEEEQAPAVQRDGTVSAGQAPDKGQPAKKKKDRKEKKRKHKGSKQSPAAEESSAHHTSPSLAEPSHQGQSLSLEPTSAAAADDDDNQTLTRRKVAKRSRSESADPLEAVSPSAAAALQSPSDFPELQGSAKRFAGSSPKSQQLNHASPHRPAALGKPASPTIKQLFSRQDASQSPSGAKTSSAPASAAGKKPTSADQAMTNGTDLVSSSRAVLRQTSVDDDSAADKHKGPEKQDDRHLVKQAAGMLSEVLRASPAGKAAYQRSLEKGGRAGQPTVPHAPARLQSSSPISSDESSAVRQMSKDVEQAIDVTSPAGTGAGGAALSERTDGHLQSTQSQSPSSRRRQKHDRTSTPMAEVIDLSDD